MCGSFSVSRFLRLSNYPVLRTAGEYVLGVRGLSAEDQRGVNAVNILVYRMCQLALSIHNAGGLVMIENPPSPVAGLGILNVETI